jgi:hypothetical protein
MRNNYLKVNDIYPTKLRSIAATKKTPTHQEIRMLNGGLVPFAQGTK